MVKTFLALLLLSVPLTFAYAALPDFFVCEGSGCQLCHLVEIVNVLTRFLITFGILFGVVMVAIAGFNLVLSGGNESAKERAKGRIMNVLIGFVIVLIAYLMVSTVMSVLTGNSLSEWGSLLECVDPPESTTGTSSVTPEEGDSAFSGTPITGATRVNESDARDLLAASGISVNKTCEGGTTGTCLQGMNRTTIDTVTALNADCGRCVSAVTGGTETGVGHACSGTYSHCSGYKIDLRPTPALDSYITTNYTSCGARGGYCDRLGNEFVREGDHWDVLVTKQSSGSTGNGANGDSGGSGF